MVQHEIKLRANDLQFSADSTWPQSAIDSKKADHLIFLLHGFPDDRHTWDETWPLLTRAFPNALVIAPSLRGYEPSSVVPGGRLSTMAEIASDVISFAEQLAAPAAKIQLVGHDWGAIISFKAANLRPDLIDSIATLAIPYLANIPPLQLATQFTKQLWLSSYMVTMQFPFVYRPRLEQKVPHIPYIEGLWRYWSPSWKFSAEQINRVCKNLQQPGVIDATTGYYRTLFRRPSRVYPENNWVVDFEQVPTLLIAGQEDGCMTVDLFEFQKKKLGDHRVEIVQGAGHFMQNEKPGEIADIIIRFLKNPR